MSNKLSSRFENNSKKTDNIANENLQNIAENQLTPELVRNFSDTNNSNIDTKNLMKSLEEKIHNIPVWFDYSTEQQIELINRFISAKIENDNLILTSEQKNELINQIIKSISNFGAISQYLSNEKIQSITVNGTQSIYIEIDNKILNTEDNLNENQLKFLINSIKQAGKIDKFKDITKLTVDNLLITIIDNSISTKGINIRIQKNKIFTQNELFQKNIMNNEIFNFILSVIKLKKNIVISGDTNTFKTKLIEVILPFIATQRVYLIEKQQEILTNFKTLSKFQINNLSPSVLISELTKQQPEYLISDLNFINIDTIQSEGSIITIKENSVENVLKSLISCYISTGLPEKFAKSKALEKIDYIIHFTKNDLGYTKLHSIIELKPSKTMQTSLIPIVRLSDDSYISNIPQPITNMRAKSLQTFSNRF